MGTGTDPKLEKLLEERREIFNRLVAIDSEVQELRNGTAAEHLRGRTWEVVEMGGSFFRLLHDAPAPDPCPEGSRTVMGPGNEKLLLAMSHYSHERLLHLDIVVPADLLRWFLSTYDGKLTQASNRKAYRNVRVLITALEETVGFVE